MMNTWRNVTINDLGQIITGSTPPTKKTEYYGNKYPFITPTDIEIDSRLVHTKRFLSQKGYEYNKNRLLPCNAVCVVCIASIGKICMTTVPSVTNQQINSVVVDQRKHDPYFVYYLLSTKTAVLKNIAAGVAVPIVKKSTFANLEVCVPPLQTQRKIAAVLSAYDNLIANNTRRIKILEDMAQTLYREWFVHFRFPGHENVSMVESPLGPIPEGWEVKEVKEIVKRLKAGKTYREIDVDQTGKIIVVDQSRADFLGFHDNEPDHNASPKDPIVIFGDHTCKMQLMVAPFSLGPNVVPFIAKDKTPVGYLFFLIFNLVETREYKRYWTELNNKVVAVADSETSERFSDFTTGIFQKTESLKQRNQNLRQTRDLLLPQLISGEIDVSELDINVDGMQPIKGGTHIPYPLTERLHADEKILGGKPVIKGTRLAVAFILDLLKQGWSEEEVIENYPNVAREDIEACRTYQEKVTRASVSR